MSRTRVRGSFVVAGLAASAVAALRAFLGGAADLVPLEAALEGNDLLGVVHINWYVLNAIFVGLALALFVASVMPAAVARTLALVATCVYGVTAVAFMVASAIHTGSPFAYPPWIPLSVATALCGFAAARASADPAMPPPGP